MKSTKAEYLRAAFKDGRAMYLKRRVGEGIGFDSYGRVKSFFVIGPQSWTTSKAHAAKFTPLEADALASHVNDVLASGKASHIDYAY